MRDYKVGDRITFLPAQGMLPPMTILDAKPCETDYARPLAHQQYKVIDPEGNEDWICGYDAGEPDGV